MRVEFHPTLSMFMVGIGYLAGYAIVIQLPGFAIMFRWNEEEND